MSLVYWREVLGIDQWIYSPVEAVLENPPAVIRLRKGWVTAERAMVDKIIGAVGLHGLPTVAEDASTTARHMIAFDTAAPAARVMDGEAVVWNLGPLRAMMDGPPAEVQAAKRDVWNLLKQFKEEAGI